MVEKQNDDVLEEKRPSQREHRFGKRFKLVVAMSLLLVIFYAGYLYVASPAAIRKPTLDHYHFRMQVLVNGKAENFGTRKYQIGYAKDQCNANLPEQPIHFHDNKDQFVHIHWKGMTGGMVLKYYGWNFIGGMSNALGYKLDNLKDIQKVTTRGSYLPAIPKDAVFYVYVGDKNGYKEKSLHDFTHQDLEKFFGKASDFPAQTSNNQLTTLSNGLFPKAYAHGDEDHSPTTNKVEEERLARINNLIGNVVIFVQNHKPTDLEIADRFSMLEPLSDSTCGG